MTIALLLVAMVGLLDGVTGPDYSFSAFYLVPVVLTAWYAGRSAAILIAVTGAVAWLAADIAGKAYHDNSLVLLWNDFMELTLFLFAAYVISELKERLDCEEEAARTDHLTGIANRRRFGELADDEIRRSRRYHDSFTVIYIDIDNFKTVNDTLGHSEGDRLLRQVAATIAMNIRESDTVARLGGDEFGLLLPVTDSEAAVTVASKMYASLKANVEEVWPVTFSIGMVTYCTAPASTNEMIRIADQLMYEVKNSGKNELRHLVLPEE
jgi:diguanylate cyclase (GGDEF)-like protein